MMIATTLLAIASLAHPARQSRIKDIASIEGVRDNQLMGYGLVVGLAGTGDKRQTLFSAQTLTNMLEKMGISVSPTAIQVANTAAVMVTATLPPFAQTGTRIDITAAAIGDSKTLQGGLLLMTQLKGTDGQTYAVAQGPVVTGGFSAGKGGANVTSNHPTVGRIPAGAIVEKSPPTVLPNHRLKMQLYRADFTTASRMAAVINGSIGNGDGRIAKAETASSVVVDIPPAYAGREVDFISAVETLSIEVDRTKHVVINEKTGTIVMGRDVPIAPVAIFQGGLTIRVESTSEVSQPAPLSGGTTTPVTNTRVEVKEEKARQVSLRTGSTVDDLVQALMSIGTTPRELIAILENLKAEGALDAEIEVI